MQTIESKTAKANGAHIEPLSPALHALVTRMYADDGPLGRRIYDDILETVSDYRLSTDAGLPDDLRTVLGWHIRLWRDALLEARVPSHEVLEQTASFTRRRVHQGVTLDSLLRAFRIGSGVLWDAMIEAVKGDAVLEKEVLLNVSPYLLHHFDIVSHHVAQAYMDEQFQQASWRDRVRGELWSVISARREDVDAFARYCNLLNIDAAVQHVAIAFAVHDVAGGTRLDSHALVRIAREMGMTSENCMYMRYRDHLVMWVPTGRGEPLVDGDRRIGKCAQQVIDRVGNIEGAGIGLPGIGAKGWWTSLGQAFKAIGHGLDGGMQTTRYSSILLDEAIANSDSTRHFLDAILERLAVEPHLLETLRAYLHHQQHRKSVANVLGVHPNTIDHRLQRIETLLGGSFGDVTWLAMLSAALHLQRRETSPTP